jgi:hypothetical protein
MIKYFKLNQMLSYISFPIIRFLSQRKIFIYYITYILSADSFRIFELVNFKTI